MRVNDALLVVLQKVRSETLLNFRGAHAIHGAYWHSGFGELVSDGCLDVSPADGHFLFGFTEPKVPEGWHGARWDPHLGPTTMVVVHR